mgnify:CR=1 FL=1
MGYPESFDYGYTWFGEKEWNAGNRWAVCWAVTEAVHDRNKCRCLFATHYHELTRLAERLDALQDPAAWLRLVGLLARITVGLDAPVRVTISPVP